MTIAELRMLGRKINEANLAKAQVAPVVPEVTPVFVDDEPIPVKEAVTDSYVVADEAPVTAKETAATGYVIVDDVPPVIIEKPKKAKRKSVASILGIGKIFTRKEHLESFDDEPESAVVKKEATIVSPTEIAAAALETPTTVEIKVDQPTSVEKKGLRRGTKKTGNDLNINISM